MTQLQIDAKSIRGLAVVLVLLTAGLSGVLLGLEVAVLVLSAGALVLVIALLWASVQSLTGATPLKFEEALSLGAPTAEEEQKRSLLRALKDLEYERSVGKLSAEDYAEFSERYRTEAKRLIQVLDEDLSGARRKAEALLERRLRSVGVTALSAQSTPAAASEAGAARQAADPPGPAAPPSARCTQRVCAACNSSNELDANFCKKCGSRMADESETLCHHCPSRYAKSAARCPECSAPRGTAP